MNIFKSFVHDIKNSYLASVMEAKTIKINDLLKEDKVSECQKYIQQLSAAHRDYYINPPHNITPNTDYKEYLKQKALNKNVDTTPHNKSKTIDPVMMNYLYPSVYAKSPEAVKMLREERFLFNIIIDDKFFKTPAHFMIDNGYHSAFRELLSPTGGFQVNWLKVDKDIRSLIPDLVGYLIKKVNNTHNISSSEVHEYLTDLHYLLFTNASIKEPQEFISYRSPRDPNIVTPLMYIAKDKLNAPLLLPFAKLLIEKNIQTQKYDKKFWVGGGQKELLLAMAEKNSLFTQLLLESVGADVRNIFKENLNYIFDTSAKAQAEDIIRGIEEKELLDNVLLKNPEIKNKIIKDNKNKSGKFKL